MKYRLSEQKHTQRRRGCKAFAVRCVDFDMFSKCVGRRENKEACHNKQIYSEITKGDHKMKKDKRTNTWKWEREREREREKNEETLSSRQQHVKKKLDR